MSSTSPDPVPTDLVEEVRRLLIDEDGDLRVAAARHVARRAPLLPVFEQARVVRRALAEIDGLGLLDEVLDDPEVDEVMVNDGDRLWVERAGRIEPVGIVDPARIAALVERLLVPIGRRLDRAHPVVDARLPDGSRLCAVIAPVARNGIHLCIRRLRHRGIHLEDFAGDDVVALLRQLVVDRCNIVVAGPTSSGKTTLLGAMVEHVSHSERLVILEDTAELLLRHPHVVALEARPPTPDGPAAVELQQLVRAALRLRPDRIVVGEVRGAEALDLLQALNTGHDGSLATVHANSTTDTIRRLVTMVLRAAPAPPSVIEDLVRSAVDVVVHVGRDHTGARQVLSVAELAPPGAAVSGVRPLVVDGEVVGAPSRGRQR
jgi:pilus assembly protein CpaF